MRHPVPLRARILVVQMDWLRSEPPRDILDPLIQESEMSVLSDTRYEKLKTWVTPTLTRIHHGCDSRGGTFGGVTEGGHVTATTLHEPGSGLVPPFACLRGTAPDARRSRCE